MNFKNKYVNLLINEISKSMVNDEHYFNLFKNKYAELFYLFETNKHLKITYELLASNNPLIKFINNNATVLEVTITDDQASTFISIYILFDSTTTIKILALHHVDDLYDCDDQKLYLYSKQFKTYSDDELILKIGDALYD